MDTTAQIRIRFVVVLLIVLVALVRAGGGVRT